ncbi:TPA: hypothetical protein U2I44_000957 [Providencia rettgeri]|nr:hypothetical protein [Providencia rettgeri]
MSILPLQPNFDDGFTPENDIFGRKKLYEQIKNIVSMSSDESIVLGLDDDWGNGKTSFVRMVEGEIAKHEAGNINVIYFDAFKSDYQSDPLLAMLASIYSMIQLEENNEGFKDNFLKVSKAVALSMLKHTPKAVVSLLSSKLISNEVYDQIKDTVTDALSEPLEKFIEEKIEGASKEANEIESFKSVLESIYTSTGKKTLFIIDELDRAKPDFSLGIIEKVKHLFDVRGFCFLLVMNRSQFEETIKLTYGNINTSIYLNKFIHMWFKLPILKTIRVTGSNLDENSNYLFDIFSKYIGIYIKNQHINRSLSYLLACSSLSLREAERCVSLYKLCYSSEDSGKLKLFESYAISILIFSRVKSIDLMTGFLHKEKYNDEFKKELMLSGDTNNICSNLHALIDYHYCDDATLTALFEKNKTHINTSRLRPIEDELRNIVNTSEAYERYTINNWKVHVFEKLSENMEYVDLS